MLTVLTKILIYHEKNVFRKIKWPPADCPKFEWINCIFTGKKSDFMKFHYFFALAKLDSKLNSTLDFSFRYAGLSEV